MKKKKSIIICLLVLCFVFAVSAMSMGFASWHTDITSSGNVAAAGKWDVSITDANMNLSTGASASVTVTNYNFERTGEMKDNLIASTISDGTWIDDANLVGTPSNTTMDKYVSYYAVDTTKYSLDFSNMVKADCDAIIADESTVKLSDHMKMYYRYINGSQNLPYDEFTALSEENATKVVSGLLNDANKLLEELYPDTYQNYVLCDISYPQWSHVFAKMKTISSEVSSTEATYTDTEVNFADVTFALPGAWAQYTITVANNGTADANLADAIIQLETESDQLVLDKPDLSDETLKPGESCIISFVVKVPETITDDLNATGKLTVKLPYNQLIVEDAPAASHTH